MAIKAILESPVCERFVVQHLSTNVRSHNRNKGRFGWSMIVAFFSFFFRLVSHLARFRPQVVYYFVTATRMGWLGRDVGCVAISRLFRARVVVHMRAGHFKNNLRYAPAWQVRIIRWACHRTSWNLVQSECLRNQFEGLAPDDRIVVVPNMIDVDRYAAVEPCCRNVRTVLFLGHLSQAKGYCDLLKIIPAVVKQHPNVVFRFAGEKLDRERNVFHNQATGEPLTKESADGLYQQLIQGRFERNYEYVGILDEKEKIAALRECSFLVLPSYSEGFSMAILEAISTGKPVVCTSVGAMGDILEPGVHGEVVRPGDIDALARGVIKLLDDQSYCNHVSRSNATFARKNFSQTAVARQLGDLWQSA